MHYPPSDRAMRGADGDSAIGVRGGRRGGGGCGRGRRVRHAAAGPPAPPPADLELAPDPGEDPQAALDAARARLRSRAERLARELDGGDDDGREGPGQV
jgi:hypothetical protein